MSFGALFPTSAFSPTSIAGLTLWLKADAGVTQGSGTASAWADQSGNSHNATQGTGANQPSYSASAQNGLPGLTFASGKLMAVATPGTVLSSSHTILAACKPTSVAGTAYILLPGSGAGASFYGMGATTGAAMQRSYDGTNNDTATDGAMTSSTPYILTGIRDVSGAKVWAYLNGDAGTSASLTSSFTTPAAANVGASDAGASNWVGDIYEIVVYNTALSSTNRGLVRDYLNSKWAIY